MAKQLNVNLAFSADTSKVKAQLQDLQNQLNKLTLSSKTELGITKDIEDASRAAAELSVHLKNATNQQTGTLDFSKLNQSIKQSGTSLQQYGRTLQSLGPQGQQAFMSLAQAVANSEVPIRRTNAMLKEMGTTLANTARWQLSSSMLHGFMGAVQSAYGYAQDLNESLNNIRIVTGQNIDQMTKFAEEANKAARALSTTTTEYTNASLIYYQQGLNDQQVKERTDITIKMANVARQSAEVVSDQMTAVWNNFYDGSKSLEHYADVMTALGAATASSTDEIAEGLNKFAAVADTVGLSYEYAASALATVTATTRQSADVVGTAFKTLFARIQDLELGKTLDDGTTLGSYSQALAKVGVQIKDTSGEMKSMDAILEEMAAKWDTLGKAEQIALAQSVAGVRQYTQLIALMDNWDFMEKNLATSNTSSGALQKQADIQAESWEAARDRVRAAAEGVYKSLINDEFFIDVLNNIEKIIVFIDDLIDNLGGLKGILTTIGAIVTKVFSNQLAQGLTNMTYNIKMMSETGRKEIQQAKNKFINDAVDSVATIPKEATPLEEAQQESMRSQLTLQSEYLAKAEQMSVVEQETNKLLLDRVKTLRSQVVELESQREKHAQIVESLSQAIQLDVAGYNAANPDAQLDTTKLTQYLNEMRNASNVLALLEVDGKRAFRAVIEGSEDATALMDTFKSKIQGINLSGMGAQGKAAFETLKKQIDNLNPSSDSFEADLKTINAELEKLISKNSYILKDEYVSADVRKKIDALAAGYKAKAQAQRESAEATKQADKAERKALETINDSKGAQAGFADGIVKMANVAFSAASAFNMLSSAIDTLSDPDISIWEKFTTVLMTLGMVIPTLVSVWKTLKSLQEMEIPIKAANAVATWAQVAAEKSLNKEKGRGNIKTRKSIKETIEDTKQKLTNTKQKLTDAKQKIGDNWNQSSWNRATDAQKQRYTEQALKNKGYYKGKHGDWMLKGGTKANKLSGDAATKLVEKDAAKLAGKAGGKALGAAAATAAIVVASVVAAGAAVKLATDYYNRHEIAAQKAAESAKRLAENYNELKAAESAFRDNISSYTEAVNSLDQLTKGTTAYKEAVMAANEEALKLLETNDNLQYTIDEETGLIEIDAESLDKARADSLKKEQLAQATALSAQQNAKNKQLEADMVEFNRTQAKSGTQTWDNDDATVATGAGIAAGALGIGGGLLAAGAVNGWNPVGWVLLAAGALTGLVGGAMMLFSNDAQELEQEALDAIAKKRQELGEDLSAEQIKEIALKYDDTGKLGESLAGTTEALNNTNDMAEAINENTAALRANSELILSQEYGSAAAEWLVDTYDSKYNSKKAELEKLNKNINRAEDLDEGSEASQFIAQYEALTGKQMDWDYHVAANGDDEREFIYYETNPETGEKEEKRMNYQDMIEEMAVAYAMAEQSEEAAKVRNMLTNIEATQGINTANALASWTTTGELGDGITLSNFDNLQSSIDAAGGTEAYLEQTYGKDINEIAKELGYGSATLLLESFDTAMADKQAEFQDAMEKIPDAMQESFKVFTDKNVALGELTAQEYSAIATPLQEAFVKGGETGYKMVEGLLDSADTGAEMTALGEALSGIDWEKATPDSLREKLDELGISTEMTTIELEALIGVMIDGVIKVSQIGQEYASLLNALQSGDSINYDQYMQMVERGLGSYFTYMYDGTYKLIDAATGFRDILKDITQNDYRENMAQAETRLSEIQTEVSTKTAALNALGDDVINKATGSTDLLLANYTQGKVSMNADGKGATQNYTDWVTSEKEYTRTIKNYGWFGIDWLAADSKITGTETVVEELKRSEKVSQAAVDTYNARIDYIEALGIVSDEMIESWRTSEDMVATEKLIVETYLPQAIQAHEELATLEAKQRLEMFKMEQALASTATTFTELQGLKDSGDIGIEAWWQAYEAMSNQEDMEGLEASAVQEYSNYLASANIESNVFSDELQGNAEAAKEVAKDIMKLNNGIDKLASNFEGWNDVLEKSDEGSQEYAEAMNGVRDAMSDVLGISEEYIDNDYIVENLEDIEKAAEGDAEAIDRLKAAMAENIICKITAVDNFSELDTNIQTLHNKLLDLNTNIEVGASLNIGDFITAANDLITKTGMTVDQAQAYFNSLGYEPTFVTEKKTVPLEGTRTYTENVVIGTKALDQGGAEVPFQYIASSDTRTEAIPMGSQEIEVPALSADGTPKIKSLTKSSAGSANNYSKVNSGGPKINNTKTSDAKAKKSDVVERYKEVTDKIDDVQNAMNDASKAADRLWGPSRLEAMRKANKALEENIELLKDERAEAEYNLKVDKQNLKDTIKTNAGINITDAMFDEKGNFTAYDEVLGGLWNELSAADNEQEKDAIQKRIDAIKEAIDQYDDTNQIFKNLSTQVSDEIAKWQDNNYDDLNIKLEYEIAVNESELELIDYYLGRTEDNIYSFVEAMGQYEAQKNLYTDSLQAQEDYYYRLEDAYKTGKISLQAYKEGLASSQSAIISNLQSLEESKQAMQDYYGNVMSMAIEEIGLYTTEMEQLNSVLDHYSNIIEIIGKQDDTITKGKILASKANNLKNELAIQSKLYKETSADAEYWAQKMAESIEGSNEYETFKKNWQAAQQTANEAQDAMLSKTQEWAEAMKAIVENELAGFATSMEESLTGGLSFDELMTSMERRSSLQEEYLTTTNKIYETNKLMRTAQQEIDKTTNTVAKKRLQNFIRETNELQGQAKLSQYELEIQQAKYDLLLAEIALEEAQQAKSTVRLTRDSEGNFGYVYTADANAVADAEQQLADAQNNLYNIGLEGANDYQQKYAETLQESQDAITELTTMWMSGEIASEEEFNRRKQEIIEYYGEKLKQYSNLHSVALSADSRVVADAWSSDFTDMMVTTDQWKNSVDSYFKSAADSMETWAEVCATTVKESGLDDIEKSLESVDEKSKQWITTLIGEDGESGVVGALMAQVDVASKVSESAITIQDAISQTTAEYKKLLTAINDTYTAMTTPVIPPRISLSGGEYLPVDPWKTNGGNGGGTTTNPPKTYTRNEILAAQKYVGTEQDGSWGRDSKAKAKAKVGSEDIGKVLEAIEKEKSRLETQRMPVYSGPSPETGTVQLHPSKIISVNATPIWETHKGEIMKKPMHQVKYEHPTYGAQTGYITSDGYTMRQDYYKAMAFLDTGGYTGSWGTEGKIAMLHEKELVLNADDTTNFLASLEVLREIVNTINLHSMNAQLGGLLSTPRWVDADRSQLLEQQVHIEASFPNVQNRNEIEEAFNNLVNKASQYINRK